MRRSLSLISACFIGTATLPIGLAKTGVPETWASVESTVGPRWHGRLEVSGGKLTMTESGGRIREIDPATLTLIEFNRPRYPDEEKPETMRDGDLPPPWKSGAIGDMPHGGTASVKNGSVIVETSAPDTRSEFTSFFMAYRPLPEGDCHITARIARIDTYEDGTHGGIMMRDGTDTNARNVLLSLSHRRPAAMRHWKKSGGSTKTDLRKDSRPGHWLRLVRKEKTITGYVSENGKRWREIWSVEDLLEGEAYACLTGSGRKPRRRWATVFDNLTIGKLDELHDLRPADARISLIDGNIFHAQIESASPTLLRLGGSDSGKAIPILNVARVEFYYPAPPDQEMLLTGERPGLVLPDGDFFEGKLESLQDGTLSARSPLFGLREFALNGEINALVLRPAAKTPPPGQPFVLETWQGGRIYGKAIRIEGGQLAIDTIRLRTRHYPLSAIRRLTKRSKPETSAAADRR